MRVVVYSARPYDQRFLSAANADRHDLPFLDERLTGATADLARDASAACLFANDRADAAVIGKLASLGIRLVALRSAGFDNVDLAAAGKE